MKYTPGPWQQVLTTLIFPANRDPNAQSITLINVQRKEWQANARLIAAAPDLLRELETAIAWIEELGEPSAMYAPTAKEILPQLRAAIAKIHRCPTCGGDGDCPDCEPIRDNDAEDRYNRGH